MKNSLIKSTFIGLIGALSAAFYIYFRIGNSDPYLGIVVFTSALTGFVLLFCVSMTIFLFKLRDQENIKPVFYTAIFISVYLLYKLVRIWL